MSHTRTVGMIAGLALLISVGTGGCTEPAAKPKPLPSPTSSSPSMTSSPSRSADPTPPALPSQALDATRAGATAFARHYVSQINYAMHSGDTQPLRRLSREDCSTCLVIANGIDRIYDNGGRLEGAGWLVRAVTTALGTDKKKALVTMQVQISRQVAYPNATASPTVSKPNRGLLDVSLIRLPPGWRVRRLDAVE